MNEINVETKELNEREMEKVIAGIFLPIRPPHDENKDGGATGSW